MKAVMVKVRRHIVNVQAVADAHWEGLELFLHFTGGSFAKFRGNEANLVFAAIASMALDLETGEVGEAANVAAS